MSAVSVAPISTVRDKRRRQHQTWRPQHARATVVDVRAATVPAQLQAEPGNGNVSTSTLTAGSDSRSALAKGRKVNVIVKACDFMLAVDD